MAAVPVTIVGTITTKAPKGGEVDASGTEQCVIHGLASIEGLGVGGGPIIPPPGAGDKPPGIWGGGNEPFPTPPIHLPPDQPKPPEPISPPVNWKAVWHPTEGWIVVGVINPEIKHPVPSSEPPKK